MSWMQLHNRRSPQYIDGVREFILFARDHMKPETDKIWCPCYRCNNHIQKTIEEVEIHLYAYGVVTSYTRWVYHGEGFELNDNDDSQNENDEYLDNVTEKSNSPNTEVREVIHDIRSGTTTFGYVGEASSSRNPDLPSSCGGETNKFARLMRDAEQDLYPDCQRFSKLLFMALPIGKDLKKARWYVLNNCDEIQPYVRQYMDELERQGLRNVQERLESEFHTWFLKYGMSTRGRGRAGYVPRPHAPTPHASTKLVRSSTQSTPGPHASIKSVRSSTLHPFTSESVHEVTSQVSHSDTSSTHCNTDVGTSKGKRGRGKSRSLKLAKLKNQGVRLPIQICKVSGRPYGEASEKFTSELGIVTRQFAPQNVPSWTDISEEDKETLVAYLQEGFKFTNEPYAIESILNLMHDRYKSYRHDLRQRFRSFPTMESALADPPENMEKETWKFLCEKWSDKDYKVRCGKNKLNREKLKVLHTAGSKAFRKNRATGEELGLVELYKKTHFSEKKEAWVHADAEIRHYKLEKRQEKAIEEGSCPISDEQLSIEVFGQKVGYIRGLGRGRKPSTTLSGKLTRAQLERDNEAATREAEEQRRINEELVERIQILESDRTKYNAKVDFLMQQISRRVPSTDSSSYVLQACVDLKLGSSLLDFECHFNETIEKKMR
ncbi:unnamed protein product [Camellia sinensis]